MSRYNQYGYFYDPGGGQSHQPTGYSYPSSATPAAAYSTASDSSSYQYGGNTYGTQQYGTAATQRASDSASRAAAALSSLSNQNYNQASSSGRSGASGQYDNSSWYPSGSTSDTYGASNLALPNRSQSNTSPLYASSQSVSTFGRLSPPEQTQSSSNTFAASSSYLGASSSGGANSYQTAYTLPQSQPPRYNSPLQAVQAQQHGHSKQDSRGSSHNPSPQMAQAVHSAQQNASRQHSASAEPSPTTVDPSQVYDNRAELQRKAQIEAEKRRKHEAEQAAKKAEEERIEAEKRKAEEEKQKAEEEAAKKEEQERKKKSREEKRQSKSAATALQKMASGGAEASSAPPANDEEEEMRAMFQKMREFNSKNPAMLARLWEEERKSHAHEKSPQAGKASPASASKAPAPSATSPTPASPNQQGGVRPFKTPTEPTKATKAASGAVQNAQPTTPTQPAAQPVNQASTSLWPPHMKGTLAEATAKWLRSQPQNAVKIFTAQSVLNILDKNPSYVQLCESLEALGLKFERAALARELLRAVPDGLKAQPVAKPATPVGGSKGAPDIASEQRQAKKGETNPTTPTPQTSSTIVNYEAPISLSDVAREVNSMDQNSYQSPYTNQTTQSPYFAQPRPVSSGSRPPSQLQPPEIKQEVKPDEPPRPPADKEEAARKRTFGDLVDLTAEDSEDEVTGPPTKKVLQSMSAPVNGFHAQLAAPYGHAAQQSLKQYVYKAPGQIDNRSPYNAWQLQGPGAPLGQQQHPNGIPQPAQQPPIVPTQPVRPRGPSAEQQQQARMKGKMLVEPIMRDRVDRKSKYDSRTIARDVLLATGRHPDMRGLNAHLSAMQKLLAAHGGEFDSGGNRADLSTVKWDIIDPDPPKEDASAKRPDTASTSGTIEVNPDDADDEKTTTTKQSIPPLASATVIYEIPASHGVGVKARRGRPPKSSLTGSKSTTSLTNGVGLGKTPRQTSCRPATPTSAPTATNNNNMSSGKPVGYSQFRHVAEDGTVIKKKGRPFGWRKNVHSREAQGLAPATLPSRLKENKNIAVAAAKKGGEEHRLQQPQYLVYRCEWSGCRAELHNLETLKKHVIKVHGRKTGDGGLYECWWKGCGALTGFEGKVKTFGGIEEWVEHVDKEHLRPIAWRLGDGPGVRDISSESAEPPAYLFDGYGRSVTPIITPPSTKTATPAQAATTTEYTADSTPPPHPVVQRLGRGRPPKDGISKAERDLGAPLKKLEEHQKAVGPTMDRMGCVLADERRRQGFLDDEDFEDEVYGSDYDPGGEE